MWNLFGPGIETMSPALAGRFLPTAPSGKQSFFFFFFLMSLCMYNIWGLYPSVCNGPLWFSYSYPRTFLVNWFLHCFYISMLRYLFHMLGWVGPLRLIHHLLRLPRFSIHLLRSISLEADIFEPYSLDSLSMYL